MRMLIPVNYPAWGPPGSNIFYCIKLLPPQDSHSVSANNLDGSRDVEFCPS